MTDQETDDTIMLLEYKNNTSIIRLLNNEFIPASLSIKSDIILTDSLEEQDFEICLSKCNFWLENIVSKCIAFKYDNKFAHSLTTKSGNNKTNNIFMVCPDDPLNDHLSILFQSKLTALCNNKILFNSIKIESSDLSNISFRFMGDSNEILPDMENWIGKHTYFENPWWNRNDASTLDVIPFKNADLTKKPEWAFSLDFLENAIKPKKDIILHHDFNPKVIDCNKKDH